MTFPYLNPAGTNQHSPRANPSTVTRDGRAFRPIFLKMNVGKLALTMMDRAGNMRRTDPAILEANLYLAMDVQTAISNVLAKRIREKGREQKQDDIREGALFKAINSADNRDVKLSGYTVGYLERFPDINPYFRGLEQGSDVFLGRFLRGSFKNRDGGWVRPIEGGKDYKFVQWQKHLPKGHPALHGGGDVDVRLFPGILIRNPIRPYHYFREGVQEVRADGMFGEEAVAIYVTFFYKHGFDVAGDVFRLALKNGSISTGGLRAGPNQAG